MRPLEHAGVLEMEPSGLQLRKVVQAAAARGRHCRDSALYLQLQLSKVRCGGVRKGVGAGLGSAEKCGKATCLGVPGRGGRTDERQVGRRTDKGRRVPVWPEGRGGGGRGATAMERSRLFLVSFLSPPLLALALLLLALSFEEESSRRVAS